MESTIRLFKAVPIRVKKERQDEKLLERTLADGFVLDPKIVYNYRSTEAIVNKVKEAYGLNTLQINSAFHKSWAKVRDASMEQLVTEQLVHYFTTYGFEALGIYDDKLVYVPDEELNAPEGTGLKVVIIKGLTKAEIKKRLLKLLESGIALKEQTVTDCLNVALIVGYTEKDIEACNNKEVKAALYDFLNIVPSNNVEFLRYIVYRSTGTTLLIKNQMLINQIKVNTNINVVRYFQDYEKQAGLEQLSRIFYRFKPIFLAFRTNDELKRIINKVRRMAVRHHKPMPEDFLNSVTAKLKRHEKFTRTKLVSELEKVNTFRKVRLAYALRFRTNHHNSILYRVRNGRSYAGEFEFDNARHAQKVLEVVKLSIAKDLRAIVKDKKIYIPEGVKYTLPATEKQFTGNFPSGSSIGVEEDMVAGIHWEDAQGKRVDLDLSLISPETGKIGWDGGYRTDDRQLLFSGDVTSAPKPDGASELFHVGQLVRGQFIIFVNYYNYDSSVEVPYSIMVAKEHPVRWGQNYMVHPDNLKAVAASTIDKKQKILGIIDANEDECRFYFCESALGNSITSTGSEQGDHARRYLIDYYTNALSLNDALKAAGAEMVETAEEADIDLSPEKLEKDTIINLMKGEQVDDNL